MNRREVLGSIAGLACYSGRVSFAEHASSVRHLRKVRPGEPGWPSEREWNRLARSISGELIRPKPLLEPCRLESKGAECRALLANLRNPFFLGDQVSGTQVSGWLDAWSPAPSAYAVAAASARDVAAAVRFASRHRLRLVIKGGGHSYQGTSTSADSLMIWTRRMHDIKLHDDFVAVDCAGPEPPSPAVSVGAGAMWIDVYDAVTTRAARYVQGGGCTTVGVAGLVQSGGFGSFSKRFGTAASSLLEAEVVTADGMVRTVNRRRDPDLFWALQGGGGGTFGVVTRVTLRTHELPKYFGAASAKIQARGDAEFKRLLDRFLELYASALMNPSWGESVTIAPGNVLEISLVSSGLDASEIERVWQPFFSATSDPAAGCTFVEGPNTGSIEAVGWWDAQARRKRGSGAMIDDPRPDAPATHAWWSGDQEQVSAFLYAFDSVWLPAALLAQPRRQQLVEALFAGSRAVPIQLHFNKGLAGAPDSVREAARGTATNPHAADAFALAIIATGGPPPYAGIETLDREKAEHQARAVASASSELRNLAPGAGSYVSESNYFNPQWQDAFWGTNYPRLREIKSKYDPKGLFYVRHGVGTEAWSDDGFERAD
jgi:FAD/FMN-containing dehydrogenase